MSWQFHSKLSSPANGTMLRHARHVVVVVDGGVGLLGGPSILVAMVVITTHRA
jgi:hypothetical protein